MKILFLLLALSACVSDKNLKKPTVSVPQSWMEAKNRGQESPYWWRGFSDEHLDQLVEMAIEQNNHLAIAKERILEARAKSIGSFSNLWPFVSLKLAALNGQLVLESNSQQQHMFQTTFDASYEFNLFGSNAYLAKADKISILGAQADMRNLQITLIAEVSSMYISLRYYQQYFKLLEKILQNQQKILELTEQSCQAGLTSPQDQIAITIDLHNTQILRQKIKALVNASYLSLLTLIGHNPGAQSYLLEAGHNLPAYNHDILLAKPSDVILNRADVKIAEFSLYKAQCIEQAALRSIFPSTSISAMFGKTSGSLQSGINIGQILNIAFPILNWGRLNSAIKVAKSRNKQALLAYKQSVIDALADVQSKIYNYQAHQNNTNFAKVQMDEKQEFLRMQSFKKDAGIISQVQLLKDDIDFCNQQIAFFSALNDYNQAVIALAKALGI